MSTTNFLLTHWEEQCRVFSENLATIRHRPTKKAVHDLRVAVKKLKSCLRLAHDSSIDHDGRKFKSIQQFFRITGKYRDVDISLSLLRKTGREEKISIPALSRNLQVMLRATRDMVQVSAQVEYDTELGTLTTWMKEKLSSMTDEELAAKTEELAAELLKTVRGLSKKFAHNAHAIRKHLKQLYYWLKLCPVNPFFDKTQMKSFEKALTALGTWHDYFVLQGKTRSFRKEYLVKGTADHEHAKKLEEITKLLQEQWLVGAEEKLNSLFSMLQ